MDKEEIREQIKQGNLEAILAHDQLRVRNIIIYFIKTFLFTT